MQVRSLVEMHGGAVRAHSDGPGRASVFSVVLPVKQANEANVNSVSPKGPSASLSILVVDDNRDVAEALVELLQIQGHEAYPALDGRTALEVGERRCPDLVLMDIGMPGMNGYEVSRQMRLTGWGRKATLVALSGWGQEADRLNSRDAGFDAHLVKPVDFDQLESVLAGVSVKG